MTRTRILGCLLVAAAACLSAGMASAAGLDPGQLLAQAPDLTANVLMASAAVAVPMRAKFVVASVDRAVGHDGGVSAERVKFNAVCPPSFDKDGLHEDSTFSRYTPQASCEIYINNPALHGKYAPGQKFYVDFTPAPAT